MPIQWPNHRQQRQRLILNCLFLCEVEHSDFPIRIVIERSFRVKARSNGNDDAFGVVPFVVLRTKVPSSWGSIPAQQWIIARLAGKVPAVQLSFR